MPEVTIEALLASLEADRRSIFATDAERAALVVAQQEDLFAGLDRTPTARPIGEDFSPLVLLYHRLRYDRGQRPAPGSPYGSKPIDPNIFGDVDDEPVNPFDLIGPLNAIDDPRTAREVLGLFQQGLLTYKFDGTVPRAVSYAAQFAASKVTETSYRDILTDASITFPRARLSDLHRNLIRDMVVLTLKTRAEGGEGVGTWQDLARNVQKFIGMNAPQLRAYMERGFQISQQFPPVHQTVRDKILRRLQKKMIRQRAVMIARTETMTALNAGRRESYSAALARGYLPASANQIWMVTNDDRLCPICAELDGIVVGVRDFFPNSGGVPPAHPNCRCTTAITDKKRTEIKAARVREATNMREEAADVRRSQREVGLSEILARRENERRDADQKRRDAQPASTKTKRAKDIGPATPDRIARWEAEITALGYDVSKLDLRDWPEDRDMDPVEFVDRILGSLTLGPTQSGAPASFEISGGDITVEGGVYDRDAHGDTTIGYIQRDIRLGENWGGSAHHSFFKIYEDYQAEGYGKVALRSQMEMYEELGFSKVDLNCNINVGGYAWAKYGFAPQGEYVWDSMLSSARWAIENDLANKDQDPGWQGDALALVEQVEDDVRDGTIPFHEAANALASLSLPTKYDGVGNRKGEVVDGGLGAAMLLGTSWDGIIDLDNSEQMANFWAYVSRGK